VQPKINQNIFLQTVVDRPEEAAVMRSRVADVDQQNIHIEVPLDEKSRKLYRAHLGEKFQFYYFTPDGVKHLFVSEVTGHRKDIVPLVSIRKPNPDEVTKDQRRSYLRVEANLELAVKIGDKLRFVAVTEDIGGGGLSFMCEPKWPIDPNSVLSCWLLLSYKSGTIAHASFEGEVVRVMHVQPERNLIMLRFKEIADAEQQKIIRYCFERQLDNRKD
jgi:c-di-GMP-binding flagellar brake protein YcgR